MNHIWKSFRHSAGTNPGKSPRQAKHNFIEKQDSRKSRSDKRRPSLRCPSILAVLLSVIAVACGTGHYAFCGSGSVALEARAAAVPAENGQKGTGFSQRSGAGSGAEDAALPVLRTVRYEKPSRTAEPGIQLSKTVTPVDADTWRITLEAYVTGSEQEVMTPTDLVLLLDTSGSMNFTYEGGQTRLEALKNSVCSFLDQLTALNEGKTEDSQVRVGLEKFCNEKDTQVYSKDLIRLDQANAGEMKKWVNSLTTGNLTMTNLAMSDARDLLSQSGKDRRRAVILFTDGQPNASDGLQPDTANKALASAREIKKAGGEIYVISIVPGAYAGNGGLLPTYEKLAGDDGSDEKFIYMSPSVTYDHPNCPPVNTTEENMTNLTNRFMHLISSNNPSALNLDAPDEDASKPGRTVAENGINYYMTAADPQALTSAFSTLVYRIGSASADLGANAQLRDEVTSWFLPDPASLAVYKAARVKQTDGSFGWSERVKVGADAGVTADIQADRRTIVVRGFDYAANYVSEQGHVDGPQNFGSKLICEFLIHRDNLIGGNQIPTNTAESGLYRTRYLKSAVGFFDLPYVDVPIRYAVKAVDYAVYVPDRIDLSGMLSYLPEHTPDGVNNTFVNISYVLKDEAGENLWAQDIPASAKPEKDSWNWNRAKADRCRTYDIDCVITPTQTGQVPVWNSRIQAAAHVYRPTLVLQDTRRKTGSVTDVVMGDSTTVSGLRKHHVQTLWQCDDNKVKSAAENEPKLGFRVTPLNGIEQRGEKYYLATEEAASFRVEVFRSAKGKLTDNITADTTFVHQCDGQGCDFDTRKEKDTRVSFLIHGGGTDDTDPGDGAGGSGKDSGSGGASGEDGTDAGTGGSGEDGQDTGTGGDSNGRGKDSGSSGGSDGTGKDAGTGGDSDGSGKDAGTGGNSGGSGKDSDAGEKGENPAADGDSGKGGDGKDSGSSSGNGGNSSGGGSGGGSHSGGSSSSGNNSGSSSGNGGGHSGGSGSGSYNGSSGSGNAGGITLINNNGSTAGSGQPGGSALESLDGSNGAGAGTDQAGGTGTGAGSGEQGNSGRDRSGNGSGSSRASSTLQKRPQTGDKDGLTGWLLIAVAAAILLAVMQAIRLVEKQAEQ